MINTLPLKWIWGKLLLSSEQSEFQEGHLEINPDAGAPFRRERFSDIGEIVQGSIILNQNDKRLFQDWYKNDLRQGAIPFTYYDCIMGVDRVARILEKPVYSNNSNKVNVQLKMMFIPQEIEIEEILCVEDFSPLLVNDGYYIYQDSEVYI